MLVKTADVLVTQNGDVTTCEPFAVWVVTVTLWQATGAAAVIVNVAMPVEPPFTKFAFEMVTPSPSIAAKVDALNVAQPAWKLTSGAVPSIPVEGLRLIVGLHPLAVNAFGRLTISPPVDMVRV